MNSFWLTWLKFWSGFLVAFGVLFALVDLPVIGVPAQLFSDFAFLRLFQGSAPALTPDLALANGVLGAVMIALGLFMFLTIESLARHDNRALKHAMLIAFSVWLLFDQWASWRAGAYGNMISNMAFYLAFALPFLVGQREGKASTV